MSVSDEKKYLEEYFAILEEFFKNLTGKTPANFSSFQELPLATREFFQSMLQNIGSSQKRLDTLKDLEKKLLIFYAKNGKKLDRVAQEITGFKLCHPGNSHIGLIQYRAIKVGLFWADSVVISDPIYPWIKDNKKNDKHRLPNILQECFALLKLKRLFLQSKDSHLIWIYPSVIPLEPDEEKEKENKEKQEVLIADFFNSYINKNIYAYAEIEKFLEEQADYFLKRVHQKGLFMVKGGNQDDTQEEILKRYKQEVANSIGTAGAQKAAALPPEQIIFKEISDRLAGLLDFIEEARSLNAHPVLADEIIIQYFSLVRNMTLRKLVIGKIFKRDELIDFKTIGTLFSKFPGDFPNKLLISQRKNKNIVPLRNSLAELALSLSEKQFDNDKISIAGDIENMSKLLKEYSLEFQDMMLESSAVSLRIDSIDLDKVCLKFIPAVAPLIGVKVPFIKAEKYFIENLEDLKFNRYSAGSMLGFAVEKLI